MSKIILGIDPGTNILGYGLIEINNSIISLKYVDIIYLKNEPSAHKKLEIIFSKIQQVVKKYQPVSVAIEAPFYGKNAQSMLKLGRAQGVAIAAVVNAGIEVHEYSAKKIKQSITGNGNASKEQVSAMACSILKLKEVPAFFDETDALATALCHYLNYNSLTLVKSENKISSKKVSKTKSGANWESFINNNPNRIKK